MLIICGYGNEADEHRERVVSLVSMSVMRLVVLVLFILYFLAQDWDFLVIQIAVEKGGTLDILARASLVRLVRRIAGGSSATHCALPTFSSLRAHSRLSLAEAVIRLQSQTLQDSLDRPSRATGKEQEEEDCRR